METLPVELKVLIAEKIVKGSSRYALLQVSKEWRDIVWPFIFMDVPQTPNMYVRWYAPTMKEMDQLEDGQSYLEASKSSGFYKHIHVRCSWVDTHCLIFTCPFCWTKYKKSGRPTAKAKRKKHIHGSNACLEMGFRGIRVAHCDPKIVSNETPCSLEHEGSRLPNVPSLPYNYPPWWHPFSRVIFHLWITHKTRRLTCDASKPKSV